MFFIFSPLHMKVKDGFYSFKSGYIMNLFANTVRRVAGAWPCSQAEAESRCEHSVRCRQRQEAGAELVL